MVTGYFVWLPSQSGEGGAIGHRVFTIRQDPVSGTVPGSTLGNWICDGRICIILSFDFLVSNGKFVRWLASEHRLTRSSAVKMTGDEGVPLAVGVLL